MGILNVTPDSFSDGGRWDTAERARMRAFQLVDDGAGIIDLGGESTRPGAVPVSEEVEIQRVIPALESFAGSVGKPVSIDTMKAPVARAAVEAGASMINDVSGLSDPLMAETAAELDVPLVIMNSYGTPSTFKTDFIDGDIMEVVTGFLRKRITLALDAGVKEHNLIMDPGLGFGTTSAQCQTILDNASVFGFGKYPVLIGPSRKRFLSDIYPGMERDEATAEACVKAAASGADILRVHEPACVAKKF